ncbi:MAG: HAD family phosphatase [Firmicutes bacterium]|nr:HAD family phosphatase [Bacillota bacterium]
MNYRLLAVDLDDTLLNNSSVISDRNKKAIHGAVEMGVQFLIVTGRMFKTSVGFLEELGFEEDCPLINYHGALVKRARSRETLLHKPIPNQIAIAVLEEAEKTDYHISVFLEDQLYIREENEQSRYYQSFTGIELQPVGSLSAFLDRNGSCPTKMSIIQRDGTLEGIEEILRANFDNQLSILQSRPFFLEITDRLATKGQTLSWFIEQQGIRPDQVIAIGDGPNDIDMLAFAGLGVAVANARPEVKAAADLVTASNEDDGVAEIIEHYILKRGE